MRNGLLRRGGRTEIHGEGGRDRSEGAVAQGTPRTAGCLSPETGREAWDRCSSESSEGYQPHGYLDFSSHQNCEIIHFRCFKLPTLWDLVRAAPGNKCGSCPVRWLIWPHRYLHKAHRWTYTQRSIANSLDWRFHWDICGFLDKWADRQRGARSWELRGRVVRR